MNTKYSFEDYEITKPLGLVKKRKFNQVYLVQHQENKSYGVLKHFIKTNQNQYLQEFIRQEANLTFNNNFLPQILAFEESDHEIKLIKNYCPGIPLNEFWKKIPKRNHIPFLILFLKKLEPIFEELQLKKLIHCDIKPGNFIINGTISDAIIDFDVYLIDFGLSFFPNPNIKRKTIFSLAYSAPEIILNKLHLANHSSDLFSLGITIYKLLNDGLPFNHQNPAVTTNLQLAYPIQKTKKIPVRLFYILEKICYKEKFHKPPNLLTNEEIEIILKKGISKRYQSLKEINQDFQKIKLDEKNTFQRLIKIFSYSKIESKK